MSQIKAEYVDHMGDDLRIVNAARVSFDKESWWKEEGFDEIYDPILGHIDWWPEKELVKQDKGLISYLARHGHFTPFTHPQITLRETVPIFVARQRFKHVVGFTYNEVSRRYVDEEPEFYVPEMWRSRPDGSVKQGSGLALDAKNNEYYQEYYTRTLDYCEECYRQMIVDGVAPEQARMVLPQSMMTSYYVTGSLAAFARAYKLRIDNDAQEEIRQLAEQWDTILRPLFPVSWEALTQ